MSIDFNLGTTVHFITILSPFFLAFFEHQFPSLITFICKSITVENLLGFNRSVVGLFGPCGFIWSVANATSKKIGERECKCTLFYAI